MKIQEKVDLIKILCDQSRFLIISLLINSNKELCVSEIAQEVNISHSAASHQLTKLEMQTILKSRRVGQNVCYFLNENRKVNKLKKIINTLTEN